MNIDIKDLKDPAAHANELVNKFGLQHAMLHVEYMIAIVGSINSHDGWCNACGAEHSGDVYEFFLKVDTELKKYMTIHVGESDLCSFCDKKARKKILGNPNTLFISCYDHQQLAQQETEKFFKEYPDFTKWHLVPKERLKFK